jgi:hypothetical protein
MTTQQQQSQIPTQTHVPQNMVQTRAAARKISKVEVLKNLARLEAATAPSWALLLAHDSGDVTPPRPRAPATRPHSHHGVCRHFEQHGRCRYGTQCRYKHLPAASPMQAENKAPPAQSAHPCDCIPTNIDELLTKAMDKVIHQRVMLREKVGHLKKDHDTIIEMSRRLRNEASTSVARDRNQRRISVAKLNRARCSELQEIIKIHEDQKDSTPLQRGFSYSAQRSATLPSPPPSTMEGTEQAAYATALARYNRHVEMKQAFDEVTTARQELPPDQAPAARTPQTPTSVPAPQPNQPTEQPAQQDEPRPVYLCPWRLHYLGRSKAYSSHETAPLPVLGRSGWYLPDQQQPITATEQHSDGDLDEVQEYMGPARRRVETADLDEVREYMGPARRRVETVDLTEGHVDLL